MLRNVYCSKTVKQRGECVEELRKVITLYPEIEDYFERNGYLNEDKLNFWTSLYKLCQYAEHGSNYIERWFAEVSVFNLKLTFKIISDY